MFSCILFALFYCLFDLSCGECNVIFLYVWAAQSIDLSVLCVACLTVSVNCLVKQLAICLSIDRSDIKPYCLLVHVINYVLFYQFLHLPS